MIINVDSDGVVYDMMGILTRRTEVRLQRSLPMTEDFGLTNWNLSKDEIDQIFEFESQQHLFDFGEAIKGAVHGVLGLTDNHQVRIVTNKSLKALGRGAMPAMQDTVSWYQGVGLLGLVDVVFTNGYGKQAYPADIVIDDQPNMAWTQEGAANILFDQPWNKELTGEPNGRWIRAGDWDSVLELVEIEEEDR